MAAFTQIESDADAPIWLDDFSTSVFTSIGEERRQD